MLEKTKGIILHHLKYGESSIISHVFTEKYGRKSFLIKGVRSKRSGSKANLFQPLFILNFEFYSKANRELNIVKEASLATSFHHFPYDVHKSSQALFIAEFLSRALIQEEKDMDLFHFLENTLEYFDLDTAFNPNFHLAFITKTTKYLGILPGNENEAGRHGQIFNIREGNFEKTPPLHYEFMDQGSTAIFRDLLLRNYEESSKIKLNRDERNHLLKQILTFYSFYHFNMDKLKSIDVLKEVFN